MFGAECSYRDIHVHFKRIPLRPSYLRSLCPMVTGHGIEVDALHSLSALQARMSRVLSGLEGVRWCWCQEEFAWKIEYGTRPSDLSPREVDASILHAAKWAGIHAAVTAKSWFPQLEDMDAADLVQSPKWCVLEIRVYANADTCADTNMNTGGLYLHFNRMTGCRIAFYHVLRETKRRLNGSDN